MCTGGSSSGAADVAGKAQQSRNGSGVQRNSANAAVATKGDKGGGAVEGGEENATREPLQELVEAGGGRCESAPLLGDSMT